MKQSALLAGLLSLTLVFQPTLTQAQSKGGADPYASQIIDPGVPGLLRQFIDVNGDGWLDYCRFVGSQPKLMLSCQLGTGNKRLSKNPYGYNSQPGIDVGSSPSGLIDRGGNGFHFVEYCRYLDKQLKAKVADTSPIVVKKLSCLVPGKTGFKSIEDVPAPKNGTFDLMRAPDGSLIEYVTRADGSWSAEGTDHTGVKWALQSGVSLSNHGTEATSYIKLIQLTVNGKPVSADDAKKKLIGVRLIITSQASSINGYNQFIIQGFGGPSAASYTPGKAGEADVGVERDAQPKPGKPYPVKAWFSSCSGACFANSRGTTYSGVETDVGSSVTWAGATPDLKSHSPAALSLLNYFRPVISLQSAKISKVLSSIDPTLNGKNWWTYTQNDWSRVRERLSSQGQEAQGTLKHVVAGLTAGVVLEGLLIGIAFTSPFGALAVGVGGFLVHEYDAYVGDMIVDNDKEFCKNNPAREGCGKPKEKEN